MNSFSATIGRLRQVLVFILFSALFFPLPALAGMPFGNPLKLTADIADGARLTDDLRPIVFTAAHPGAAYILDVDERVLLINGEDRTAQTTLKRRWYGSFTLLFQPSATAALPQGEVEIELTIPVRGWKWWNKTKHQARLHLTIRVDSVAPEITRLSPAAGESINDLLSRLTYSVTDSGSGIDGDSLAFRINGEDQSDLADLTGEILTYSPTRDRQLPEEDFQVNIDVADSFGNEAGASFEYQVETGVSLSAIPLAVPQTAYAPALIRFSPKVTTNHAIVMYWWDFDGNGSDDRSDNIGNSYTWNYTTPGDYRVALRVEDTFGETFTGYTTVRIKNRVPEVSAEAAPSNGEIPLTVAFTVTASDNEGIDLYEWDFEGDGTYDYSSPTSGTTSHTYVDPGQYRAILRVTDGRGEATTYTLPTTTVNAGPPGAPTVTAAADPGSGTAPLAVSFSAAVSDPQDGKVSLWEWDFDGDGTFDASDGQSGTVSHTYERAGSYYPLVKVTMEDGRTGADAVAVKIINDLSLSRDLDTIDTTLSETAAITTTLSGTTRVSLVVENSSFEAVRTLVDWTERAGGSYTDNWDGLMDDGGMAPEGDYYAVLLYEEDGVEKRLDLRNSSGGSRYNPSRDNAARTFAPFANDPMSITYQLPVAAEVTAFIGYSNSNTRVVTFLSREPQARGAHTILWYGTNNEGVVIYPPPGKYFMFGVWAYRLADNGIYLKSGSSILNVAATPPLYDPTTVADGGPALARIAFTLTGDADVELRVNDAETGTLAAKKNYSGLGEGEAVIEWDGRNEAGEFLAPGRYRLGLTAVDGNGSRSLTQYTLQRIHY